MTHTTNLPNNAIGIYTYVNSFIRGTHEIKIISILKQYDKKSYDTYHVHLRVPLILLPKIEGIFKNKEGIIISGLTFLDENNFKVRLDVLRRTGGVDPSKPEAET